MGKQWKASNVSCLASVEAGNLIMLVFYTVRKTDIFFLSRLIHYLSSNLIMDTGSHITRAEKSYGLTAILLNSFALKQALTVF